MRLRDELLKHSFLAALSSPLNVWQRVANVSSVSVGRPRTFSLPSAEVLGAAHRRRNPVVHAAAAYGPCIANSEVTLRPLLPQWRVIAPIVPEVELRGKLQVEHAGGRQGPELEEGRE